MKKTWDNILLSTETSNNLWELFHLNAQCSKSNFNDPTLEKHPKNNTKSNITPYINYPSIPLPSITKNLDMLLIDAIESRFSEYNMLPISLNLEDIATLFLQGYSLKNNNSQQRTTPSAGALYPIEIFFHYSTHNNNMESSLKPGLYYYHLERKELRLIINKNCSEQLNRILIQQDIIQNSSLQIFITSIFSRSTNKYGDRGYKFCLLEAGHIAQNLNLKATAMGLVCVNIGGYDEKEANNFLKIDGLSHSTVYMIALGAKKPLHSEMTKMLAKINITK